MNLAKLSNKTAEGGGVAGLSGLIALIVVQWARKHGVELSDTEVLAIFTGMTSSLAGAWHGLRNWFKHRNDHKPKVDNV